jgi:hypothetical protein
MIVKNALLLAAGLMLGSCCLSGNCYAPMAGPMAGTAGVTGTSGVGVAAAAPDGLGSAPTDEPQADAETPAKPRKSAQRRKDFDPIGDASAASRYRRGDTYEEQQAADQADEARLKRKLIICQNCSSSGN